jgi:hypothetical protein
VEHLWLNCDLDRIILQEVKNQSYYTLLFNIIRNSYRTNYKIEEGMITSLSHEVTNTFQDSLSKHNSILPHGVSGHSQVEEKDAGSLLSNSNKFKQPFASKIRYLLDGTSASHFTFSPPAKEAIWSALSSEEESRPLVTSIKKSDGKKKSKDKDSDSSTVVLGLAVGCVALVALIVYFCACRGDDSASPYDLGRDDKPLLGLTDLTGGAAHFYSVFVQYVAQHIYLYQLLCVHQVLPVSPALHQSMSAGWGHCHEVHPRSRSRNLRYQ